MNDDAYIDGTSLRSIGVRMGDGFLDAVATPAAYKDFTQVNVRTRHGVRVLTSSPRYASRDLTLTFIVCGDTAAELSLNKSALLTLLGKVSIGLYVPSVMEGETLWLVYTGKSVSLSTDLTRTTAKLTAKFIEPDPSHRTKAKWVEDIEQE